MNKCKDCKKEILNRSKRCRSCENIRRHKLGLMNIIEDMSQCRSAEAINKRRKTIVICETFLGKNNPMFGRKGKNCPSYIHGEGYYLYPKDFNSSLKRKIRKRDNFTCRNCGMTEEEHLIRYKRVLEIHHIDHNKNNNEENNLLTLCRLCNMKDNQLLKEIYGKA